MEHCAACRLAGIPEPTIEEWVNLVDEAVQTRPPPTMRERDD